MKWLDFQILGRNERLNDLYIANADLFDAWVMNSISDSNYKKPIEAPPLLLTDKLTLNRYVTRLAYFKASDRSILRKTINEFLPNAIRLINMIQKEYHLE
jgi:hypothetical protein